MARAVLGEAGDGAGVRAGVTALILGSPEDIYQAGSLIV